GRMRGVVPVEVDAEIGEVALLACLRALDEHLRRDAGLFRGQHDRRAVGVVRADEMHRAAGLPPRAHPDVGLDVADQVADVQVAVAVGQGTGDDRGPGHVLAFCGGGGLSHGGASRPPQQWRRTAKGPAHRPGPWRVEPAARYWRCQTCDLQMKATQPDTSSLLPPSINSIFDLYTLPSSGLRMVPPA